MKAEIKWVQRICTGLWTATVLLLVLVLFHLAGARLSGQIPALFGYSVFRITTGSMEPTIPAGTYIITQKVDPREIQKGDIITFYSTDPDIAGFPNTHRVADKPLRTGGGMIYATKGDANPIRDNTYVHESRLIGKYRWSLSRLSGFLNFFQSGKMLWVLLLTQILSIAMMTASLRLLQQHRTEKKQQKALEAARKAALAETLRQLEEGGPEALERLQTECAEKEKQRKEETP